MTMCMALSISCQKEFIEHCNVQKTLDHECAFDKAYSLEIMNQAISTTLSKRGITRSLEQQLEPTHKYVKFMPQNRHQFDFLNDKYALYIMDKPDDYNCQNWIYNPSSSTIHYTPLFIDILDDFNQYYWYTSVYPNSYNASRVCNDVIRINRADIIEQIAFNSQNVAEVKDLLEDYITEEDLEFSQSDIDDLFEFYMLINN